MHILTQKATAGGVVPCDMLGTLLLLTHSDSVIKGCAGVNESGVPQIWTRVEALYAKASGSSMKQLLCERMEDLCTQLLSPQGTQSKEERQRVTALRVLGTLARQDMDTVLPKVMDYIGADVDAEDLLALSARDVAIYYTPEGELAKNTEFDSGYVCEVSLNPKP